MKVTVEEKRDLTNVFCDQLGAVILTQRPAKNARSQVNRRSMNVGAPSAFFEFTSGFLLMSATFRSFSFSYGFVVCVVVISYLVGFLRGGLKKPGLTVDGPSPRTPLLWKHIVWDCGTICPLAEISPRQLDTC